MPARRRHLALPDACARATPTGGPLLQEKGWDVDQTIEKLLHNGTRISAEAHEVVRIPGLLTDADMIGEGRRWGCRRGRVRGGVRG